MGWWDNITSAVGDAANAAGNYVNQAGQTISNDWNNGRGGSAALDVLGYGLGAPLQAVGHYIQPAENAANSVLPAGFSTGTPSVYNSNPSSPVPDYGNALASSAAQYNPDASASVMPTMTGQYDPSPTPINYSNSLGSTPIQLTSGSLATQPSYTSATPYAPPSPQVYAPPSDGSQGAAALTPDVAAAANAAAPVTPTQQTGTQNNQSPDWFGPALQTAGGLAAAGIGAYGAKSAADAVADAQNKATAAQEEQQNKNLDQQKTNNLQQQTNVQPWIDAGAAALPQIQKQINSYDPSQAMNLYGDPGYSFRLDQGLKALQNSAAARSGLISGNTEKGLNDYAQNSASQEYQNAFNRYNTSFGTKLNATQSLAGLGQTAVGQANQASQNYSNNLGQIYTNLGNAQSQGATGVGSAYASGDVGMANAGVSALNQALQSAQSQMFVNALTRNKNNGN